MENAFVAGAPLREFTVLPRPSSWI